MDQIQSRFKLYKLHLLRKYHSDCGIKNGLNGLTTSSRQITCEVNPGLFLKADDINVGAVRQKESEVMTDWI